MDEASARERISLERLLRQLQGELSILATGLLNIEVAIARLLPGTSMADRQALVELQHLDTVAQSIAALEGFLSDLAAAVPAEWAVDPRYALERIKLADIAGRLGSGDRAEGPARHHDDIELF